MLGRAEADLAGSPFAVVSTGVPWLIVALSRFEAISDLHPNQGLIARECKALRPAGLTVFVERGDGGLVRIRVRTFAPGEAFPRIRFAAQATALSRSSSRATNIRTKHRATDAEGRLTAAFLPDTGRLSNDS